MQSYCVFKYFQTLWTPSIFQSFIYFSEKILKSIWLQMCLNYADWTYYKKFIPILKSKWNILYTSISLSIKTKHLVQTSAVHRNFVGMFISLVVFPCISLNSTVISTKKCAFLKILNEYFTPFLSWHQKNSSAIRKSVSSFDKVDKWCNSSAYVSL